MKIKFDEDKYITMLPGDIITKLDTIYPLVSVGNATSYIVAVMVGPVAVDNIEGLGVLRGFKSIGYVADGIAYSFKGERICAGDWKDVLNNSIIE